MTAQEQRPGVGNRASAGLSNDHGDHQESSTPGGQLTIPELPEDCDKLTAALAYIEAGWYIGPARRGTKNPGSRLGKGWQYQTSRDRKQAAAWLSGTDNEIFLHMSRSGAIGFDVDHMEHVPDRLVAAIKRTQAPAQSSRVDGSRLTAVFTVPPGTHYSNSKHDWGDIKADNGVIMAEPSVHELADQGGLYKWLCTGVVPELPDDIADIPSSRDGETADAATDAEVEEFLAKYTKRTHPLLFRYVQNDFQRALKAGESRHNAAVTAACWAARESRTGPYSARFAYDKLESDFVAAMADRSLGSGRVVSAPQARREFADIWSWAVGQAQDDDLEEIKRKINERANRPKNNATGTSWSPIDLREYRLGKTERPKPGILVRADRVGLLYPGRVHWSYGEPEAGKSLLAQYATAEVLGTGGSVLYLDFESDPQESDDRFGLLGVSVDDLSRLVYVRPDESLSSNSAAYDELLSSDYTLAVVDGVTDAIGMVDSGNSSMDTDDISRFARILPRRIARLTGAAVICVDHVVKNSENRGRFPIGSQAKLSCVDGAAFTVEAVSPLGRGLLGKIEVRVAKDRPGSIRQHGGPRRSDGTQVIAHVTVDGREADRIRMTVLPPDGSAAGITGTPRSDWRS
jgi:hypothetical protein